MFNKQITYIPNRLLSAIGFLSTSLILTCLGYSYKLLSEIGTDTVDPVDVCEKINNIKAPEYTAHFILFITLLLQGWWGTGILNFPFLFYNFSQWYPGKYFLESTQIFTALSEVMWETKVKAGLFILAVLYNFWEWASWAPPDYPRMHRSYKKMVNIHHYIPKKRKK